jgi:hypothetical protein
MSRKFFNVRAWRKRVRPSIANTPSAEMRSSRAIIGLAPGLAAGIFIYKYCNNEVVGGCSVGVPIGLAAAGAGIGAALGAAGTDR